jgi:hypothetical protein
LECIATKSLPRKFKSILVVAEWLEYTMWVVLGGDKDEAENFKNY